VFDLSAGWPHHTGTKILPDDATFQSVFGALDAADCPLSWQPVTRQSLFAMPKWKQKKLLEALQKQPNVLYAFPHAEIQSIPLQQIDWAQGIVGVEKSADGTVGVYFVELPGKRGVVLKFPHNPCPEVYGERICRHCGIRAPKTCLVARASDLGLSILHAYLRYQVTTTSNPENWWQGTGINIAKAFCYDFFIVMEYVPGAVLETRSPSTPKDDWLKSNGATSASTLQSYGAVIALDMVINNLDRIRTVRSWPESNPGNIYLSRLGGGSGNGNCSGGSSGSGSGSGSGGTAVVAIDNAAAWGTYNGGRGANELSFQKRIDEIKQLLLDILIAPNVPHMAFNNVRTLLNTGLSETVIGTKMWKDDSMKTTINEYHEDKKTGAVYTVKVELEKKMDIAEVAGWPGLGLDIGDAGVLHVQHGFVSCVKKFVQLPSEVFVEEKEQIEHMINTEKIVDKNQWIDIVASLYQRIDSEGTSTGTLYQNVSKYMTWIAATSTSAMECIGCAPQRCQRVVDVWRDLLVGDST